MRETGVTPETQKATKNEVFDLFHQAHREHNRRIREAMQKMLEADEEDIDSVERVVLGLTGSFEELFAIQDFDEKIKGMIGQPVAWIGNSKNKDIKKIATITGGIEGKLHGNTHGTLIVPVKNTVSLGIDRRFGPKVEGDSEATIAHVNYHDSDPIMGAALQRDPIRYTIQRGYEKMLFGFKDIIEFKNESASSDQFGALLATYFNEATSSE